MEAKSTRGVMRGWRLGFVLLGLAGVAGLAGCGGNSHRSGGEAGGSGSGSRAGRALSIVVEGTGRMQSTLYEGQVMPDTGITFQLRAQGDTSALAGATVQAVVEPPEAALLVGTPTVSFDADLRSGSLKFSGPAGAAEGSHQGTLAVRLCLDAACTREIDVEGADIAYAFVVKPGIKLSTDAVAFSADFGTRPPPSAVAVTLPADAVSWTVTPTQGEAFGVFNVGKVDDAGQRKLVVSVQSLAWPDASFQETAAVTAVMSDGATIRKVLPMAQRVGPNSGNLGLTFESPSTTLTVKSGTPGWSEWVDGSVLLPGMDSDRLRYRGLYYIWPTDLDGITRNRTVESVWMWVDHGTSATTVQAQSTGQRYPIRYRVNACAGNNGWCLPPGPYQAEMHFLYSPQGGTPRDIAYILNLDVTP